MNISVVITGYNRKEYIESAIESVIHQSLDKDKYEIIVVTNFSIIDNFNASNLKFIYCNSIKIGQMYKVGIQNSKNEIICFLDDDDLFLYNKLKHIYDIFNENKDIWYIHNNQVWMEDGKVMPGKNLGMDFNMSSISILKSHIDSYLYECEILVDTFLYLSLYKHKNHMLEIPEGLTVYRVHDSNISRKKGVSMKYYYQYLKFLEHFEDRETKNYIRTRISRVLVYSLYLDKIKLPSKFYFWNYMINSDNKIKSKLKIVGYYYLTNIKNMVVR